MSKTNTIFWENILLIKENFTDKFIFKCINKDKNDLGHDFMLEHNFIII